MNLSVTSRHIDVSPALRDRTEQRLEQLFSKYFGQAISANVTFDRDGQDFKSNLEAHVGGNIRMNASARHKDAYSALDAAAQHLAKRLRRQKRKLREDHGGGMDPEIMAQLAPEIDDQEALDAAHALPNTPLIIAEAHNGIIEMSVAEAVEELSHSDEAALFFINSKTRRSNMLYRRADGNLGWVEPSHER